VITATSVEIDGELLARSEDSLRAAGRDGCELFVLWSGRQDGEHCEVLDGHVPRQSSYKSKDGLLVRVEGRALHKLNSWLFEHEQTLIAQLHAHPANAYHSDTDDAYPIVTQLGGLSLVAANFCEDGLISDSTAAFRLREEGWVEEPTPIAELLRVL
jgi:hypothetical protein